MFNKIVTDGYIKNIYDEISLIEVAKNIYCKHSQSHIDNVIKTVEQTLLRLKYNPEIIEDAKIAALLHDIGCINGKENHAENSYQMAKQYLENNNIKLHNQKMVLDAIRNHSDGFETDNIIASTIIFADKIDLTKNRLNKLGRKLPGVRQLNYITDVMVNVSNEMLMVQFVINDNFNQQEFETFYFIPKVFKAVSSFAKKVNLKPVILLGQNEWLCPIDY